MTSAPTARAGPILVPVDFSRHSAAALAWAVDLGRRLEAPLVILHVIHDPEEAPGYYQASADDPVWSVEKAAAEMLADFVAQCEAEMSDLTWVTTELVVGVPVRRILDVAERLNARLIVMGSRGRTGLSHLLLGSKAQSVVQLAPMPVTIVKAAADMGE